MIINHVLNNSQLIPTNFNTPTNKASLFRSTLFENLGNVLKKPYGLLTANTFTSGPTPISGGWSRMVDS